MPKISVEEIRNVSKAALIQHGALDWISEVTKPDDLPTLINLSAVEFVLITFL